MAYNVNIFASFNNDALVDPQQALENYNNPSVYLNTVPANQTCTISDHNLNQITGLSITSNGIDDGNFDIFPIKYVGEQVNFVVQLVDLSGYPVKDYPIIYNYNLTLNLSASNGTYVDGVTFYSNFGTLSSLKQGGFYKALFVSPVTADNVCVKAVFTAEGLLLTGYSSTFSIYPSGGVYSIRKVNENFDQAAALYSLATQPVLFDKNVLFGQFLGQIVGDANSDPNTLGIEVYEKISNYVSNVDDIDYSNINQLKSLLDSINSTYQNYDIQYPPSLRRLTDILSVKHKNLFGQTNQYQQNFDSKGFTKSPTYGLNKGDFLDIATTVLTAGSGVSPNLVVAYEKFSQNYTAVNANLINLGQYYTTIPGVSTYPLSSVDSSWGWDLVLPGGVSGLEVAKYYDFYNFVPGVEGSLLQKFIDFDNPNNTLSITNSSYSDFIKTGGIMDNILLYSLYTGLEVLS